MEVLIFVVVIGVFITICYVVKTIRDENEKYRLKQQADMEHKQIIEDAHRLILLMEVRQQAELVGDQTTIEAVNNMTYQGPLPEERADGGYLSLYDNLRILSIAGINHRTGIDRYVGRVECALVPEPENEFDPNAIKIVAEDRHHLGYIASGQTDFVRSLTCDTFPYRCTAFIDQKEDEGTNRKFFVGYVYIVKQKQPTTNGQKLTPPASEEEQQNTQNN